MFVRHSADSYALRVAKLGKVRGIRADASPGSRADFLHALQLLGAEPQVRRLWPRSKARHEVKVHLSCPRNTWEAVFGPPQSVEVDSGPVPSTSPHRWRHSCSDGPLICVGHLDPLRLMEQCVVLTQVRLF